MNKTLRLGALASLYCLILTSCISISSTNLQLQEAQSTPDLTPRQVVSEDYWEAVRSLALHQVENYPDSSDEGRFSRATEALMRGDQKSAIPILENLVSTSRDSVFKKHSGDVLTSIYLQNYRWDALIDLDSRLPTGIDDQGTIHMVRAWSKTNREEIVYPETPFIQPMEISLSGVPVIDVLVNGHKQTFWVDTGAAFTVLASDIAEDCGVIPLVDSAGKVGTSTDIEVDLWPGAIDELVIQDLIIRNHPVFILNKEDLEFRILKIIRILKVDGILGWNAIQNLKLDIDYGNQEVTFSEPQVESYPSRNFHFLTEPIVTLSDTTGVPLTFFLDTGANKTGLYSPAFAVFDTTKAEKTSTMVGGAGGMRKIDELVLRDQSLILGATRIDFPEINGSEAAGFMDDFVFYDGILGSDVPRTGSLILDFQNGWCEVKVHEN